MLEILSRSASSYFVDGPCNGGWSAEGWLCGRRRYRLVGKSGFRISTINSVVEMVGWTGQCVKDGVIRID